MATVLIIFSWESTDKIECSLTAHCCICSAAKFLRQPFRRFIPPLPPLSSLSLPTLGRRPLKSRWESGERCKLCKRTTTTTSGPRPWPTTTTTTISTTTISTTTKTTTKTVKERIALNGFRSHSYGMSLAIWDHTVLPATRHKWTRHSAVLLLLLLPLLRLLLLLQVVVPWDGSRQLAVVSSWWVVLLTPGNCDNDYTWSWLNCRGAPVEWILQIIIIITCNVDN